MLLESLEPLLKDTGIYKSMYTYGRYYKMLNN